MEKDYAAHKGRSRCANIRRLKDTTDLRKNTGCWEEVASRLIKKLTKRPSPRWYV